MKAIQKTCILSLGTVLLIALCLVPAHAQTFNKRTTITFDQPVEVPGRVLPAGTYTFTILDMAGTRNIVQIWNADKTRLISTILAIFDYKLTAPDQAVVEFKETAANTPRAVRAWFYPGFNYGVEFVYPKARAVELAEASNVVVPAETEEPTPSTLKTVPLFAVTPQNEMKPIAEAIQTKPAPEETTIAQALPKTASPLPLIAVFGGALIGIAALLRRFALCTS